MRPIDADALLKHRRNHGKPYAIDPIDKNIDDQLIELKHVLNAPTLDYAPVRHGEWVKQKNGRLICKLCGVRGLQDSDELDYYYYPSVYCPNCGAKMDGGKENGT